MTRAYRFSVPIISTADTVMSLLVVVEKSHKIHSLSVGSMSWFLV